MKNRQKISMHADIVVGNINIPPSKENRDTTSVPNSKDTFSKNVCNETVEVLG